MEVIILFAKVILAVLFLSAAGSKLRRMDEHVVIVEEYQLLPVKWVKPFAWAEVTLEVATGLILIAGFFARIGGWLSFVMLLMYSFAIAINLLRGRREISCGCGGVSGTHHISWTLVGRNAFLMVLAVFVGWSDSIWGNLVALLAGAAVEDVFPSFYWVTLFAGLLVLFLAMVATEMLLIHKKFWILLDSK